MSNTLYRSHSLEKSGDTISGSMTLWEDAPVSPFDVGDSFRPVESGPALTVEKVSIKDNVIGEFNGKTLRQWEITIEGSNEASSEASSHDTKTHVKYNFSISADEKSGTMEVLNIGNNPAITLDIGDAFSVPGIGQVVCSNVKGSDSYDDDGLHSWTVVYEGSKKDKDDDDEGDAQYSISVEKNSDGDTVYSGSKQVTSKGETPTISVNVGDEFSLPIIGKLSCTRVLSSKSDNGTWTVTVEGSKVDKKDDDDDDDALPDTETVITYELNGSAVRSVAGEFIALKRSDTPIIKKTIIVYTKDISTVATPGSQYEGGTVTSENIIKETILDNGEVLKSYYKHTIEVEA